MTTRTKRAPPTAHPVQHDGRKTDRA
jgi:hypothetical protein